VLQKTQSSSSAVAGDGTVIEAACSHDNLLKQEAVQEALEASIRAAEKAPDNKAAQKMLDLATKTAGIMHERMAKNRAKGRNVETLRISGHEPDAMMQKQKIGRGSAPSYKPSVLSNEQRIITVFAVDPSSETAVIPEMLAQSHRVSGDSVDELLLDAGYCCASILKDPIEQEISLLCPEGHVLGNGKHSKKKYTKGEFKYDESTDTYTCPAGSLLTIASVNKEGIYRRYGTKDCAGCLQHDKCTKATAGRKINRYPQDEHKEALRLVMQQYQAKKRYSYRKAWVEPIFSMLRGNQQLNRFRRKGLEAVKLEFSLHVLAYNIGRPVAYICFAMHTVKRLFRSSKQLLLEGILKMYFLCLSEKILIPVLSKLSM